MTTGLEKPDSEERSHLHAQQQQTPHQQDRVQQHLTETPPTKSKLQLRAPQKIWRPKAAPSTDLDATQAQAATHSPLTAQEDNQDFCERQDEHLDKTPHITKDYIVHPHRCTRTSINQRTRTSQNYNHQQQLWRKFTTQR